MRQLTNEEFEILKSWCAGARVSEDSPGLLPMTEYMRENNILINFANLNAVAAIPSLGLKFTRAESPANWKEITQAFLRTLPEQYHDGLPRRLANIVGDIIERQFDNVYSNEHLVIAYNQAISQVTPAPEPQKEPSASAIADAQSGQGGRKQTGLRNHAHSDEVEAPPVNEGAAKQAVISLLDRLANGGHKAFANGQVTRVREEIKANKPWSAVHHSVSADAETYLATLAIQKILQDAPGGTDGVRTANRQHLAEIAKAGHSQGHSAATTAKLMRMESEAMQRRSIR